MHVTETKTPHASVDQLLRRRDLVNEPAFRDIAIVADHSLKATSRECRARLRAKGFDLARLFIVFAQGRWNTVGLRFARRRRTQLVVFNCVSNFQIFAAGRVHLRTINECCRERNFAARVVRAGVPEELKPRRFVLVRPKAQGHALNARLPIRDRLIVSAIGASPVLGHWRPCIQKRAARASRPFSISQTVTALSQCQPRP
jgi:hypothetical protein